MSFARHSIQALLLTFAIAPAVLVACGGSTGQDVASAATSTDSALVVTPSSSDASLTVSADGGACSDARTLVTAHQQDLQALCAKGELPMPANVSDDGCEAGQVASITFKCVQAKAPPPPTAGCRGFQIRDDESAIAGGQKALPALPPLVCPLLGGAPPPPPPSGAAIPDPSGTGTGFYPPPPPTSTGSGTYPPPSGSGTGGVPIPDPSGTYMPPPPPTSTGTATPDPSGSGTAYPPPTGTGTSGGCVMPPVIECCAPPPPPGPSGAATGTAPAPSGTAGDGTPR